MAEDVADDDIDAILNNPTLGEGKKEEAAAPQRGMKRIADVHKYLSQKTPEEVFQEFDADKSGFIDLQEFLVMIDALSLKLPEAKAQKFFKHCDKDGSGVIDLDEFQTALYACDPTSGNTLGFTPEEFLSPHDAFQMFDEDGSGTIDEDEFADVLEYMKLEVDDFKQERLFRKYDIDGSGGIDYEEFKACWLQSVDVRAELKKRGVRFGKLTPTYLLRKQLEKLVNTNEDIEEHVLVSADKNLTHIRTLSAKKNIFTKARARADEALALALDAAGQVYMFGRGTHGQFCGDAFLHHFKEFRIVHTIYADRVAPDGGASDFRAPGGGHKKTKPKSKQLNGKMVLESGHDARARQAAAEAELALPEGGRGKVGTWTNPFLKVNCMVNTSFLWGRGITKVSVGQNMAAAVSLDGKIYAWGGNKQWYEPVIDITKPPDVDAKDRIAQRGNLTARSQKMLSVEGVWPPALQNMDPHATKRKQAADAEMAEGDRLKIVLQYYAVWTPPPSNKLRLKHMQKGLLPKVAQKDLVFSLEVRGKGASVSDRKTKTQLVELLAADLAFEVEKDVKSETLREMEKDLLHAIVSNHALKRREIRRSFDKIWSSTAETGLGFQQLHAIVEGKTRDRARDAAATQQGEVNYRRWREVHRQLATNGEKTFTPRGTNIQIPLGGFTSRGPAPQAVSAASAVSLVSVSAHHAAAVHTDGSVYTWGEGAFGRLGQGIESNRASHRTSASHPVKIASLGNLKARRLSCGFSHSAIISENGQVLVWGSAVSGKLGLGTVTEEYECFCPTPHPVRFGPQRIEITEISCGDAHTGAVTAEGTVFIWGCADAGRLGMGLPLRDIHTPKLIESLETSRIVKISCGAAHTALVTAVKTQYHGEGVNRVERYSGGNVFVCGAASVLRELTPQFVRLDMRRGQKAKIVCGISCGTMHIGLRTMEGELYTFGSNKSGCTGHPIVIPFVPVPRLVQTLYVAPHNMARSKATRQSSTYANRSPAMGVNGRTSGNGERRCTHTQLDPQAWWEVDLGELCVIERVIVWNRTDEPPDDTRPRDEFTGRLFPFWIFVSQTEYEDTVGGTSFAKAYRQSVEMKKFTKNRRRTQWTVPANTIGRYVRIQLEKHNYLHIAEVQIFGITGTRIGVSQVSSVQCGNCVTAAIIHPREDEHELEAAYTTAVRADARSADILRNYPIFFEMYDKWGRGGKILNCTLCRGGARCDICQLLTTWPMSDEDHRRIKYGPNPDNEVRPNLDYIGKTIIDQRPPMVDWEPSSHRKPQASQACSLQ